MQTPTSATSCNTLARAQERERAKAERGKRVWPCGRLAFENSVPSPTAPGATTATRMPCA
eukprot:232460-Pleurochrysis_carterae.AAC.1